MPPLKDINFKQTNLYLDQEVVFLATRKLTAMTGNKRMLSAFVNQMLEEFILEGDDLPETSIRQKARELAEKIRHEKMSQRQLIQDEESRKADRERQEAEKRAVIEQATREAVRKLEFKREYLRDRDHMCWSRKREDLADEVSIATRQDLQWKDLYPIVAAIVMEG